MRRTALVAIATVALGFVTAAIFHRTTVLTQFDHVIGDYGDTRFVLAVLEHWFRVSLGHDPWRSFNFFFPASDALGYSDSLILMGVPFTVARYLGMPVFSAFQLTVILTTLLGFVGMMLFLGLLLRVAPPIALAGSTAFAGSSILSQTMTNGHTQLQTSLWLPYLAGLMLLYMRSINTPSVRRMILGVGLSMMTAALLFTSFLVGWFALLQFLVVVTELLVMEIWRKGWLMVMLRTYAWLKAGWRHLLAITAILTVSFLPFVMTYIPVLRQRGGRQYQELIQTLPRPADLIHPAGNWLWDGHVIAAYWPWLAARGRELGKGLPWILLALFFTTMVWLLLYAKRAQTAPSRQSAYRRRVALVLGISVLICWVLMLDIERFSLWRVVYTIVPGAVGVRAVFRFNLVLVFSVITVVAVGLDELWTAASRQTRSTARMLRAATLLLCLLLAVEEINTWSIGTEELSRSRHFGPIDSMPPAPDTCRVFALLPKAADPSWPAWAQQLDAVMLAQARNVPTVNGYSGQSPLHWDLADISSPDYSRRLDDWVTRYALWQGLCGVDLSKGRWLSLTQSEVLQHVPGF
jgi:hypothetical protein